MYILIFKNIQIDAHANNFDRKIGRFFLLMYHFLKEEIIICIICIVNKIVNRKINFSQPNMLSTMMNGYHWLGFAPTPNIAFVISRIQ